MKANVLNEFFSMATRIQLVTFDYDDNCPSDNVYQVRVSTNCGSAGRNKFINTRVVETFPLDGYDTAKKLFYSMVQEQVNNEI